MQNKKTNIILFILMSFVANTTHAATLEVCPSGCTYEKIQDAIDATVDGDTVLVRDGTYVENINFKGRAITVKSINGADKTTIDGNALDSVILFNSQEAANSILDGFTIQNGFESMGGGIYCFPGSSPTIKNCVIKENKAIVGGGIRCGGNSSPTITNCIISDNIATQDGGGILFWSNSVALVTNCVISNNISSRHGGGIYCRSSSPKIINCIISGNRVIGVSGYYGDGGGISASQATPTIINCTIIGNYAYNNGGGIAGEESSLPIVINSILWNNINDIDINEIFLEKDSSIAITYSDIQGGWDGEGNIKTDPLFVDPENGNYYLQPGSPCIDTGTSNGASSEDIEGSPRPQESGYDMVVYENLGRYGPFGDLDKDGDIDINDVFCLFKRIMGRPSCMDGG